MTVTSLPITSNAIWLTTSGMTGLTLPGMMLEPACIGGRLISPSPARGPLDRSRRSLQVFDSLTATRFSTPDSCTNAPQSCVASTRFGDVTSGMPVICDNRLHTMPAYSGCALMPVPIAVAPRLISRTSIARFLQPLFVLAQHDGVRRELLPERHRHRVLQLRAAHLQHVAKLRGLGFERAAQHGHRIDESEDSEVAGDLERRRVDVVGALAHVDVFVRMQVLVFAARVAELLEPEIRDHLVCIHVRRRSRTALDDVDDELIVQPPGPDVLARTDDRVGLDPVEHAELVVRQRRRLLDARERADQVGIDRDRVAR